MEQLLLRMHTIIMKQVDCFIGRYRFLRDREFLITVFIHSCGHAGKKVRRRLDIAAQEAIEAMPQRIININAKILDLTTFMIKGTEHHKDDRSLIGHLAILIRCCDELYLHVLIRQRTVQLAEPAARLDEKYIVRHRILKRAGYIIIERTRLEFLGDSIDCNFHCYILPYLHLQTTADGKASVSLMMVSSGKYFERRSPIASTKTCSRP